MATNDVSAAGEQLDALVSQLTAAATDYKAASAGPTEFVARRALLKTVQTLYHTIRKPEEQWNEQSIWMAEMAAIRLFMKWKAFDAIPPPGQGSISYKDLAEKVNAQESLVRRIAWVLVSVHKLKQTGEDQVENTPYSMIYTSEDTNGKLFQIMYDEALIPYTKMPEFFEKYGRKETVTQTHNPYCFGWGDPELPVWEVMAKEPQRVKDFMQSMNTLEQHLPLTGFYDFSWVTEKAAAEPERVLFVDVGGSTGHAIRAVSAANPQIPATRTVLQDREDVIGTVKELNDEAMRGVTLMPHNFHTEQPVKGALIYWIRRCLHDYSDDDCANILKQLADAAAPDSRILIVEQIMENPPDAITAWTDFCMINISGKERSAKMFEELASRAGLKVQSIQKAAGTPMGCVECVKV